MSFSPDDVVNTTLFLNTKGAAEGAVKINGNYVLMLSHSHVVVACRYPVRYSRLSQVCADSENEFVFMSLF